MGKLILVRHGHTALNRPGDGEILRSWLNVSLDEIGLREAEVTAEKLRRYPIEAVYCSDLKRARQTARILCQGFRAPITPTGDLRPWNLGVFAGALVKEILPFLNLLKENPTIPAPSGESFNQFYERYERRLNELLQIAAAAHDYVLVVTHVRNVLAATCIIAGRDKSKVPVYGGPKTGTITIVERNGAGWNIHREDGSSVVQPAAPRPNCEPVMPQPMLRLQIAN